MAFEGWVGNVPPLSWERMLGMDVGGASPNALLFYALDPDTGSVVAYDEIYEITTDMRRIAAQAIPKLKHPDGIEYRFKFKVIDYENRIAAEDMRRYGIRFDNAVKHNKLLSVHRLAGYLHPNPRRPFPRWHPQSGQPNSPLFFITPNCKNLIKELPQQRWKEGLGDTIKDEMDRAIANHATDTALYVVRLLPPAADVPIVAKPVEAKQMNAISRLYYEDLKRMKAERGPTETRRPYNVAHTYGNIVFRGE